MTTFDNNKIVDTCVACEKPLTESEIAFSYNDGPVCCAACAPTPEEQDLERAECKVAHIELCDFPCKPDACASASRCWPEVGRA